MLSDRERHVLGDVERRTAAEDPGFARALREGQEQLCAPSPVDHALIAPIAVLVVILLLTGRLTTAVIVGSIAAGAGWFAHVHGAAGERR